jgi:hypothetical protein
MRANSASEKRAPAIGRRRQSRKLPIIAAAINEFEIANNEKVIGWRQFPSVRMNRALSVAPTRHCDARGHRRHDGRRGPKSKDSVLMPAIALVKKALSLRARPRARRRFVASAK